MNLHGFERQLAIEQVTHYRRLQAAAAASGDKTEYRRCVDQIAMLTTKHHLHLNKHGESQ
ncbi:hypothetical protein D3C76_415440 [compost metagenome]